MYNLKQDDITGEWEITHKYYTIATFKYEHHARTFLKILEDAYKMYSGD